MRNPESIFEKAKQLDVGSIVFQILPNGKLFGNKYYPLNPTRNDRSTGSFVINLNTGVWKDFATGDGGGDIISLYAYIKGMSQYEAAKELLENRHRDYSICQHLNGSNIKTSKENIGKALRIWSECFPANGTIVEKYLASRGII
jgi:hypothetical protein